jgi:hypothetical protein
MNFLTNFWEKSLLHKARGPKMLQKKQNLLRSLRHQKGDRKHFQYWGLTILYWPVNHTIIWQFMHNACKMIYAHIFVGKKTTLMIMLKILGITIPNLIAQVTRCLGFVYPALTFHVTLKLNLLYHSNLPFRSVSPTFYSHILWQSLTQVYSSFFLFID